MLNKNPLNFIPLISMGFAFLLFASTSFAQKNLIVSSNTQGMVGVFNIMADGSVAQNTYPVAAIDADGVHYDATNDVLYQLNRTDNRIDIYSSAATNPTLVASSTSDFTNGREIAVSGDKLVVAQDAATSNNDQNKLFVYDITASTITLDKSYDVGINLWGIHANGNQLIAIVDNSSDVAVFENFFNQPAGMLMPTAVVMIADMIRTHGITYDPTKDIMYLTDVGAASSATDGALVAVKNWSAASSDGTVTAAEQGRVSGGSSMLGNPVDIAIDNDNRMVYVAERAKDGGRILGFKMGFLTGGIRPVFDMLFDGASAVNLTGTEVAFDPCEFVNAGTVSLPNGDNATTIIVDGQADMLSFNTTATAPMGGAFTYVVTDANNMVLGIPPGNMVDFDPAGLGSCIVYGLSYTGNLTLAMGDDLMGGQALSDDCFKLTTNSIVVNRIAPSIPTAGFFVSSNNSGNIGAFAISSNGDVVQSSFASNGIDADGIFYDTANDVLYQLNRTNNTIDLYNNVSTNPTLVTSSTSDFSNGREIAVTGNKLIVAQDAVAGNNDQNRLIVYDITSTTITLDKTYDVGINLWGIHANGGQLFAVVDNSSDVAVFENFFEQPAGILMPTTVVTIDDLVRTHGIHYVADKDMMFLTDVGAASSPTDGALIRIKQWSTASADGTVNAMEQIRVAGGASALGNPVDVAYDNGSDMVYVAERANGGGRVLGFRNPSATGGIAPIYNTFFAGASGIHLPGNEVDYDACEFVDGGEVALTTGGNEITIMVDGNDDFVPFTSTVSGNAAANGYTFTYVITDANDMVLGVPPGNIQNFDPAGVGACNVYGLSYTGNLMVAMGDNLMGGQALSSECFELSSNKIVVNRIVPDNIEGQIFASSNNEGRVNIFNILNNGEIVPDYFTINAADADGIHYDEVNDVLYQLDRTNSVINLYGDVNASVMAGSNPPLIATSTSDFSNGREIAVSGNKLVVANDGVTSFGNDFFIYDITPTSITLDKIYDATINLWGIHLNGPQMIAVADNTGDVVIYDDFFNQSTPSKTVTIENLVRTHGITYDADEDLMILTDVGAASSPTDGALITIKNWSSVISDNMVSSMEQIRISGGSSLLGNPVDVAYDKANKTIYVAERARDGGRLLGFRNLFASGGAAPFYNRNAPGISAVNFMSTEILLAPCAMVMGGEVSFTDGNTQKTILVDNMPDVLEFASTADPMGNGHSFTYVITDANGMVLGIPPGNSNDFDPAGLGACNVYGLSYTGNLTVTAGDNLLGGQALSDDCFDLSSNSIVVNRIAPAPVDATIFVSSNTQNTVGTYQVLETGDIVEGGFQGGAADADGIYYDKAQDILYQLNRTDNVIKVYNNVSTNPTIIATSTSDFSNGRGLTVSGNNLVVAQDANAGNGNKFILYDITNPAAITLNKIYDSTVDLWGIHADGDRMIAVSDGTGDVVIYDDFFNQPIGTINPSQTVTIEGLVRTHGLDYDRADDMLILTDIGSAADTRDGAIIVVRDFAMVSADNMVSAAEQARAFAGADFLGNPVDIALDKANKTVYVAERADSGGRVLGFLLPKLSGGIEPFYNAVNAGASSIFIPEGDCDFLTGGAVTFMDGTTEKDVIVNDLLPDVLTFASDIGLLPGYSTQYVVTDAAGMVLGLPPVNFVDFETSGVGSCRVYNLSYTGTLLLAAGDNLFTDPLSTECSVLSDNSLLVNRTENLRGVSDRTGEETTNTLANIFPVPATNDLNIVIESTDQKDDIIQVMNLNGALVQQTNVQLIEGRNILTIQIAELPQGTYLVRLPNANITSKFIKANR